MKYYIALKRSAEKELNALPLDIYKHISSHIFSLGEDTPRPNGCKKIKDGVYRIRIGNYRVIYIINDRDKTIEIIKIAHRKEVYRHAF